MRFAVLETGGTINGMLTELAAPPEESRVVTWLNAHSERLQLEFAHSLVVMKDSRSLTEIDRQDLRLEVEDCPFDLILIPHGTHTMPETGLYLEQHLSASSRQKTIVLVGSLIPLNETDSDAPAALEYALDTLRTHEAGVWIAMHDKVWQPGKVSKDPVTGEYVSKS